jgi:hypothetical protein
MDSTCAKLSLYNVQKQQGVVSFGQRRSGCCKWLQCLICQAVQELARERNVCKPITAQSAAKCPAPLLCGNLCYVPLHARYNERCATSRTGPRPRHRSVPICTALHYVPIIVRKDALTLVPPQSCLFLSLVLCCCYPRFSLNRVGVVEWQWACGSRSSLSSGR